MQKDRRSGFKTFHSTATMSDQGGGGGRVWERQCSGSHSYCSDRQGGSLLSGNSDLVAQTQGPAPPAQRDMLGIGEHRGPRPRSSRDRASEWVGTGQGVREGRGLSLGAGERLGILEGNVSRRNQGSRRERVAAWSVSGSGVAVARVPHKREE